MDASDCDVASTSWEHWHGIPWQSVQIAVTMDRLPAGAAIWPSRWPYWPFVLRFRDR